MFKPRPLKDVEVVMGPILGITYDQFIESYRVNPDAELHEIISLAKEMDLSSMPQEFEVKHQAISEPKIDSKLTTDITAGLSAIAYGNSTNIDEGPMMPGEYEPFAVENEPKLGRGR